MKLIYFSFVLLLSSIFHHLKAQNSDYLDNEIGFIEYLIGNRRFADANYVLNQIDTSLFKGNRYEDQINYLKGWAYYNRKKLALSSEYLQKVSLQSEKYFKSQFFASYNQTYLGRYDAGINILNNSIKKVTDDYNELIHFQKAGIALLQRDFNSYQRHQEHFEYEYYALTKEEKKLDTYCELLKTHKRKSMFIAGALSVILPGSGKIYAGKTAQGVSGFLILGSLGAVTYENYRKDGFQDIKTLLFGTIFSIFYIGNVYGSVVSIKIQREEFHEKINNNILFDLHIPLRTIFN
jgi:TM2 domain-containing membrane protein YozV